MKSPEFKVGIIFGLFVGMLLGLTIGQDIREKNIAGAVTLCHAKLVHPYDDQWRWLDEPADRFWEHEEDDCGWIRNRLQ